MNIAGMVGFRCNRAEESGVYVSPLHRHVWQKGWNLAVCNHNPQFVNCYCGLWGSVDYYLEEFQKYMKSILYPLFLIEGVGQTTIYEYAFKSSAARIIGVIEAPKYHKNDDSFVFSNAELIILEAANHFNVPILSLKQGMALVINQWKIHVPMGETTENTINNFNSFLKGE